MQNSINATISNVLNGTGYADRAPSHVVQEVTAALEQRERNISDELTVFAVNAGLPETQAKEALTNAGLSVTPDPEPEPEVEVEATDEDRLTKIEEAVKRLTDLAERYLPRR